MPRLSRSYMWETEALKAWANANIKWRLKRKQDEKKESGKTRTKSILITESSWSDILGWQIFFFFEYVPSCKMSQETLSQRDIKSVDTSQQNIWHESFYERFTISLLPLTSFLLRWRLIASTKPKVNMADPILLFLPQTVCRFAEKTVEMNVF